LWTNSLRQLDLTPMQTMSQMLHLLAKPNLYPQSFGRLLPY
jgi:hypothetical protein